MILDHTLICYQVHQTFLPLDQETYSNIRYTGMGFIPEDYIDFHGNWENVDDYEG